MSAQRLLFVTPYFAPAAGSGVQRGTKFVKYLMRLGWEVEVVTIDPSNYAENDHSMVPEVSQARVRAVELSRIPFVGHRRLRALPGIRREVESSLRRFRPHVVLATTPDYHWAVVARAAREARVPYVLDYPDPWTVLPPDFLAFRPPTRFRSRIKWAVAPAVERWCVGGAAALVFATQPIYEEYASRFPRVAAVGRVITNGFDPEDFEGANASWPPKGVVRVSHVGSFGGRRTPLRIARALRHAVSADGGREFELALVGARAEEFLPALEAELGPVPLRLTGWVSHRRAIEEMMSASILWLDAMVHLRSASTGKIYEYLASGRPILALAHPDSPAAQLVRAFRAGRVVSDGDPAVIGSALVEIAGNLGGGDSPHREPSALEPFSRAVLAEELSQLLASVARA